MSKHLIEIEMACPECGQEGEHRDDWCEKCFKSFVPKEQLEGKLRFKKVPAAEPELQQFIKGCWQAVPYVE